MRALVVTVVHHPHDARIRHRQIAALLTAGWEVTYAAPFSAYGVTSAPEAGDLRLLDVPRAVGRRRLGALRAVRRVIASEGPAHDVVLIHDPELLLAAAGLQLRSLVWDVHEDTAAAVTLKPWLPSSLRRASAVAVSAVERLAERRVHLLLAEHAYADRFRQPHLVVPNTVAVPDRVMAPERPRAVYVGHLSVARGAAELVGVAQRLHDQTAGKLRTVLIGNADEAALALIRPAVARGVLDWLGYLPSGEALAHLDGAVAGLSLLHDQPNYRVSMPTKVVEYMSRGVPVVTTPLPLAEELVTRTGAGVVVPFADPEAAASTVMRLWGNSDLRHRMGAAGHQAALEEYDWRAHEGRFVAELSRVASAPG